MFARHGRTAITVLAAAVILVGGANLAAYASNGHPLLLGRNNVESATAKVKNTGAGAALALTSKPKFPSLTVSSSKRVKHLNADKIDNLDGSQVQNKAYRYAVPASGPYPGTVVLTLPGLPKGLYMASYSVIASNPGAFVQCFFRQSEPVTAQAFSRGAGTSILGLNATAVIDTTGSHGPVTFQCQGTNYSFLSVAGDAESTITFTNLTSVVHKTVTAAARPVSKSSNGKITGNR